MQEHKYPFLKQSVPRLSTALQASFLNSFDSESAKSSQDQWFNRHAPGRSTPLEFSHLSM